MRGAAAGFLIIACLFGATTSHAQTWKPKPRWQAPKKKKRRGASWKRKQKPTKPVLKLIVNDAVSGLVVKVDGKPVSKRKRTQGVTLAPGEHRIEAFGTKDGARVLFDDKVTLKAGDPPLTLLVKLTPAPPDWANSRQARCMQNAKSEAAFAACVKDPEEDSSDISMRLGTEVAAYHDTMDVDVISPVVAFGIEHVTDGWGLGASALADVVTAASPDIVATASPHWREVRVAPEIHGHVTAGPMNFTLAASLSSEPDYLSTTVGGGASLDLFEKNATLSVLYQYSHDINGRTQTPFSVFSTLIDRHAVTAGLGLVLSKATFGQAALTIVYEDGDASKPYRHIPMFDPDVARDIKPGLSVDSVNKARAPQRPLEQLPTQRMRFAISASVAHRFKRSTLRISERLYRDDWGTNASTTNVLYFVDVGKAFRVWPHVRVHAQDAADFYKLAYVVKGDPDAPVLPSVFSGDRELGPLLGLTIGGGIKWNVGGAETVSFALSGDAIYTRFFDHLFVRGRWGAFGAFNMEILFE